MQNDFEQFYGIKSEIAKELFESYYKLLCFIDKNVKWQKSYNLNKDMDINTAIKSSADFYNKYFKVNDVLSVEPAYADFLVNFLNENNQKKACTYIKYFTHFVSPFAIPCQLDIQSGIFFIVPNFSLKSLYKKQTLRERITLFKERKKNFLKYPLPLDDKLIVKKVILKELSSASPYEFTHEVAHMQVDVHEGTNTDVDNCEFLSIFLEKMHAYDVSLEDYLAIEKIRLRYLLSELEKFILFPDVITQAYIESTIKAEIFFAKYVTSDKTLQREMIQDIQDVFDGLNTVENIIKKYGINTKDDNKYDAIKHNLTM